MDANGVSQTKKSLFNEFLNAGLTDIAKDTEYSSIFGNPNDKDNHIDNTNANSNAFGVGMTGELHTKTTHDLGHVLHMTDDQIKEEVGFFASNVDDIALQMTFGLNKIKNYKNIYQFESDYNISSCCRADNDRIDCAKFERIKPILNSHEKFLRDHFEKKGEIKKNLNILKIVSFLVPMLIGMKKRMKIPDMNNLLPLMAGDEVHTERELPPLMLGPDFRSKKFEGVFTNNKYFNLHGGVQFELETCSITQNCVEFEAEYSKIATTVTAVLKNFLEAEQQLQEYKVPVIDVNDRKFWVLRIDFESFYAQFPQKPYWVYKLNDDLIKLKPKRLPMTDIQIYDLFKKYFGYKKATKFKVMLRSFKTSFFLFIFFS